MSHLVELEGSREVVRATTQAPVSFLSGGPKNQIASSRHADGCIRQPFVDHDLAPYASHMVDEASVHAVITEAQTALGLVAELGLLDGVTSEYRDLALSTAAAAVVMSYADDQRECALLERLSDCAWPRGERRADVHRLVDLALASTKPNQAEMLSSALLLVDRSFDKLSTASIEEALQGPAPASCLVLQSGALGVEPGSTLDAEKKRGRQACSAHERKTGENEAILHLRLQIAGIVVQALREQARSNGLEPGDGWDARIFNAARIVAGAVIAARGGDEQRLHDIWKEAMSLDERRALLIELLRDAKDKGAADFICKSADPRLVEVEVEFDGEDKTNFLQSVARATVRTRALGFERKQGESRTRARQRVAKALGSARLRPSRKKG
jgi:hypothetical protein